MNGDAYTLDVMNLGSGGWGWLILDNVSIPGAANFGGAHPGTVSVTVATGALADFQLAYAITNATRIDNNIAYSVNNAAALTNASFSRVKYRMEAQVNGVLQYAEASFDAWAGLTVAQLRVPDATYTGTIQLNVSNLTVDCSYPGVVNGSGQVGRLEIWPSNYGTGDLG